MEEYKIETIEAIDADDLIGQLQTASDPDWKFAAILRNDEGFYEILFKR